MSENWTDGPWHVEVSTEYDDHGTVYVCHPETSCPETVICKFDDYNDEQDRGNAHLIAAAPDLYAALDRLYGRLLMSDRDGESHITAEEGEMAEFALKKARGEV